MRLSIQKIGGRLTKCHKNETVGSLEVITLDRCEREIAVFPNEVKKDLALLVGRLASGIKLSMPVSRPLVSVGKNVFELRIIDPSGAFRVVYVLKKRDAIYLVHAFKKKSQKTPKKNLDLVRQRVKRLV
jgi:phage-related protein